MKSRPLQFVRQLMILLLLLSSSPLWAKKFYSDDPLMKEPSPLPVD